MLTDATNCSRTSFLPRCTSVLCVVLALSGGRSATAAETADVSALQTNLPLKQVGPGVFEMGGVRLDKTRNTVSFPAWLNMNDGALEYLLVTTSGKTHESLLRADIQPVHVHLAMLLLGAQGAQTNDYPENPAALIPGDKITLEISWETHRKKKHRRAEELVLNRATQSAASPGPWTYNGSRTVEGTFIAQRDGSIVSLIVDGDALINNPRAGRENDENWQVNKTDLPPLNSAVQVTIRLEKEKAKP